MAPRIRLFIFCGCKHREPTCACVGEGKASHLHRMRTEFPSSVTQLPGGKLKKDLKFGVLNCASSMGLNLGLLTCRQEVLFACRQAVLLACRQEVL
jgi:hypothetical protein